MKKKSDFLNKGILLGLVLVVIDLIGGFAHLRLESWFKWIGTIAMLLLIIIFCIQFGKQRTEGVTFGSAFGYGFKIALVASVIVMVYSVLSVTVIFPESVDEMLANTRNMLEAKGGMSEDMINRQMEMTKKFMTPGPIAIFSLLGTLFFGTLSALLGAAFTKKSEPNIFQDNP